jgi:2-polyprenyl-3-methyl-5-hydroxy-6-metoxy-1,4-benzoquinol methylase
LLLLDKTSYKLPRSYSSNRCINGVTAAVTGIDLAEKPLKVAQLHLLESGQKVDYRYIAV